MLLHSTTSPDGAVVDDKGNEGLRGLQVVSPFEVDLGVAVIGTTNSRNGHFAHLKANEWPRKLHFTSKADECGSGYLVQDIPSSRTP